MTHYIRRRRTRIDSLTTTSERSYNTTVHTTYRDGATRTVSVTDIVATTTRISGPHRNPLDRLPVPAVQCAPGPLDTAPEQDRVPADAQQAGPSTAAAVDTPLRRKRQAEWRAARDQKRPRLSVGDQPGTSGYQPPAAAPPPPQSAPMQDPGAPPQQVAPNIAAGLFGLEAEAPDDAPDLFGLEAEAAETSSPSESSMSSSPGGRNAAQHIDERPLDAPQDQHERRQWLLDNMKQATTTLGQRLHEHGRRASPQQVRDAVAAWCAAMQQQVALAGGDLRRLARHGGWQGLQRGVFIVAFGAMVDVAAREVIVSRLPALRRQVYDTFGVAPGSRPALGRLVNRHMAEMRAAAPPPDPPMDLDSPPPAAAPALEPGRRVTRSMSRRLRV